jgi:CheY-like chemotaxis protein
MATLNRYDLILLDLEMPRMSGLACARAIREHEQSTGTTPTIIYALSASIERSQSMATLEAGMNGFLSKPFGLNQLRQKLETVSVGRAQ